MSNLFSDAILCLRSEWYILMYKICKFFVLTLVVLINISGVEAAKNLSIPRFVSIKFNEVNARTGTSKDCPIEWVFIKKNEPVEVTAEFDQWRKIRDIKGEGGWVHSSVISANRFVVIVAENVLPLLASPADYNKIIAKLSPTMRCSFKKCNNDWCQIDCKSYKGWVPRKFLWGIYHDE